MPHMKKCTPTSYVTPLGSKPKATSQYQMDDHAGSSWWNSGNVNCGCKSECSTTSYPGFSLCWPWYCTRLDVQQDVVPVKKQN